MSIEDKAQWSFNLVSLTDLDYNACSRTKVI